MRTFEHQIAARLVDNLWSDLSTGEGQGEDRPMSEDERGALVAQIASMRLIDLLPLYVNTVTAGLKPTPAPTKETTDAGDDRPSVRRR